MESRVVRADPGCVLEVHPAEERAPEVDAEHDDQEHPGHDERELDDALALPSAAFDAVVFGCCAAAQLDHWFPGCGGSMTKL